MIESYEVYEDNGGGLHLAILDEDDKPLAVYSGYEYHADSLFKAIQTLVSKDDLLIFPEEDAGDTALRYEELSNGNGIDVELIAEEGLGYTVSLGRNNGRRDRTFTIHFDRLGVAGSLAFKALLPEDD